MLEVGDNPETTSPFLWKVLKLFQLWGCDKLKKTNINNEPKKFLHPHPTTPTLTHVLDLKEESYILQYVFDLI